MKSQDLKMYMRQFVAEVLLELGAIKIDTKNLFMYASGKMGPIYIDVRVLISHPEIRKVIAGFFSTLMNLEKIKVNVVVGGETAGMPFAQDLADLLGKPYFYVRKASKKYGIANRIVGDLNKFRGSAILIEDLITDGGSKIDFIEAIRAMRTVTCNHCFVILDRWQGGHQALETKSVQLHRLVILEQVLRIADERNFFTPNDLFEVRCYLDKPAQWVDQWKEKKGERS
jgi:orotate phosphoribosyltransferase